MRMWMVDPKIMCRQHLLGEHLECHMFRGAIEKGINLQGYLDKGLLEIHNLIERHDELVREMKRRNYNHKSPIRYLLCSEEKGKIDLNLNLIELAKRCKKCKVSL